MTFSLHYKDILTQLSNTCRLAPIFATCALIFSSWVLLTVYPIRSCNGIPKPSRWWPPEHGREVRKNTGPSKNGSVKLNQLYVHQGYPLFPIFHALSRSLHRHSSFAISIKFGVPTKLGVLNAIMILPVLKICPELYYACPAQVAYKFPHDNFYG